MPQLFTPTANIVARAVVVGGALALAALVFGAVAYSRSPAMSRAERVVAQPVPFSHEHHVQGVGLDCRYCHSSVEDSSFAGIPATGVCMNCHTQIWKDSPMLAPVRESFKAGEPLRWTRLHNLPDFVYFDHSIHVAKGIGCSTCHGRVDEMPLTRQTASLYMRWCLDCHRAPEKQIRPRDQVFNMTYTPPADQLDVGRRLVKEYGVRTQGMTDCVTCHR